MRLRVQGTAGTAVTITAGELLAANGTVNALTSAAGQIKQGGAGGGPGAPANAFQQETYVLCGKGPEVFTPHFTFHGFRYVQLSGYPGQPTLDSIDGLQLSAAVEPCGSFTCSNAMLNRIQEMVRQTLLSNLFSVESDCPHREKFGYGGDIVAAADDGGLELRHGHVLRQDGPRSPDAVRGQWRLHRDLAVCGHRRPGPRQFERPDRMGHRPPVLAAAPLPVLRRSSA